MSVFNAFMGMVYMCCLQSVVLYMRGLWELSDNMAPYYEKLLILNDAAMETGVLGMHARFVYNSLMVHNNRKCN